MMDNSGRTHDDDVSEDDTDEEQEEICLEVNETQDDSQVEDTCFNMHKHYEVITGVEMVGREGGDPNSMLATTITKEIFPGEDSVLKIPLAPFAASDNFLPSSAPRVRFLNISSRGEI